MTTPETPVLLFVCLDLWRKNRKRKTLSFLLLIFSSFSLFLLFCTLLLFTIPFFQPHPSPILPSPQRAKMYSTSPSRSSSSTKTCFCKPTVTTCLEWTQEFGHNSSTHNNINRSVVLRPWLSWWHSIFRCLPQSHLGTCQWDRLLRKLFVLHSLNWKSRNYEFHFTILT